MTTPATAMSVLDDTLTVATYLLSPKGRAHYKSLYKQAWDSWYGEYESSGDESYLDIPQGDALGDIVRDLGLHDVADTELEGRDLNRRLSVTKNPKTLATFLLPKLADGWRAAGRENVPVRSKTGKF